ncbi:MAG: PEPxxWA-CTERM sorting domain-containing protein, partial [Janthinobacterium lividum]
SVLTVPNTIGSGGSTSGSILYYGFYDTGKTYKSVAFGNSSGGIDNFAFDDFSIGSAAQVVPVPGVPEPTSWALMIAGFGAVGAAARRRRVALTA